MKKILLVAVIAVAGLCMLSTQIVLAQDACEGNFDCDQDVDGTDAAVFKTDFGRSPFSNPCPACNPCPYNMIDCGIKCVDPLTDGDFCGVDSDCLGGTVCGATEKCVVGVCEDVGGNVYQAPVPKTGLTTSYATGDDGDLEKGVAWPNPRFSDNLDGTVTDNLTGLIWLLNANCFGPRTWYQALSDSNGLSSGFCGLTDGSNAGDWRLPNYKELFSLVDAENYNLVLPSGHPFGSVQSNQYWSSTAHTDGIGYAWSVSMYGGHVGRYLKSLSYWVWPVRGGQ